MVSVWALFRPLPLSCDKLQLAELEPIIIQGNSFLAINAPVVEQSVSYATILGKDPSCPIELQCKYYAKSRIPSLPSGDANTLLVNSDIPIAGGAVLFYSVPYGHIAIVEKVFGDMIFISEQNHLGCGIISSRWISVNCPMIKGYIN